MCCGVLLLCLCILGSFCDNDIKSIHRHQCIPTPNATKSFWSLNDIITESSIGPLPSQNSIINITIIGCGISGSSTAYYLSKYLNNDTNYTNNPATVLLLDARSASDGASGRNAGALRVITDPLFKSTLNKYGNKTAIEYYNYTLDTIYKVINLLNSSNIAVQSGFRVETLLNRSDITNRNDSINLMKEYINFITAQLITNSNDISNIINSFNNNNYSAFIGGVYGPLMYNINPSLIVSTLINKTILNSNNTLNINNYNKMNLNIQYKTLVNSVEFDSENEYYKINITKKHENHIIKSNKIVFATNAYTSYLLPQFKDLIVASKGHVIISKPYNTSFWNKNITGISSTIKSNSNILNSGIRYYGQYTNYDNRIIFVGSPVDVDWMNDCNDSYVDTNFSNKLQQFLIDNYPLFNQTNGIQIDMEWMGIRAKTKDGYPYIGPIVNMSNCYICAGYNGLGLSQALNAGDAIASIIVGKTPQCFLDIFLPKHRM